MIERCIFQSDDNIIIDFIDDTSPLGFFALEELEFKRVSRTNDRNRMQDMGTWPDYTYFGKMTINVIGHIMCDTPELLNQWIFKLTDTLMRRNEFGYQSRRMIGNFQITWSGMPEDVYSEVGLDDDVDIIRQGLYPSTVACSIPFKAPRPYMTGVDTGKFYWIK